MPLRYYLYESRKAIWSQRIALLFLLLFAVTFALHRLGELPTAYAMKLWGVAIAGAVFAVMLALLALGGIWREGYSGAGRAVWGLVLGIAMLALPTWSLPKLLALPRISEVSTDVQSPPSFQAILPMRQGPDVNPVAFEPENAVVQAKAYPDIKPLPINRPAGETFSAVREAVKQLNWDIVAEQPPAERGAGKIEATDRSKVFGFVDDVVIRVADVGGRARIDVRSSSRHGVHDLGRNADRVRVLFSEVKTKLSEIDKNEAVQQAIALREARVQKALEVKQREEAEEKRREQARRASVSEVSVNQEPSTLRLEPDQASTIQLHSRSEAQDGRGLSKRQRSARKTQALRKFWEELGQ